MKKRLLFSLLLSLPFALSAQLNTTVTSTDISCFGDSNGTASVVGTVPGGGPPIVISQVDLGSPDYIELTNVTGTTVNTNGWFLITSDSYSAINTANTLQWDLPATVPAGWVDYREDVTGTNYWGNNLYYNPGAYPTYTGWVLLSDDQGNIVDFVAWNWPESEILNTFNVTAGGFTFDITPADWTGGGVDGNCTQALTRSGSVDNNDASDWSCVAGNKGILNGSMSLPFVGAGIAIDYLWSTGDTVNTLTDLGPGTYTVTTTGNGATVIDTVTIIEPPIPLFSLPFDEGVVCSGNVLFVDAGPGWNSYTWDNGFTGQSVVFSQAGTYVITITDSNNCPASDTLSVILGETPDLDLGPDTTLCADQYQLNAGNGATFAWNTGATSQFYTATQSGNYEVTVTSNDGCIAVDDVDLILYPVPSVDLGPDFILCYNLNQTQLLSAGAGFASYQWSTGASNPNLLIGSGVTSPGNVIYSVLVTDDNGCTANDEVTVEYAECVGTDEIADGPAFEVYPNPANDFIIVDGADAKVDRITLFDITGKMVVDNAINGKQGQQRVDLANLEAGTYIMKIQSDGYEQIVRCIIR